MEATGNTDFARSVWWSVVVVDVVVLFASFIMLSNNAGGCLAPLLVMTMGALTVVAWRYKARHGGKFADRVERTWQSVCAGLGGNFAGEEADYLQSAWKGFTSGGRRVETQTKVAYPKLENIRGNAQAWTAEVRFWHGQTLDDYNKHAQAFAIAFRVPFVTFERDEESGLIRIRAGALPMPQAFGFDELEQSDGNY